MARFRVGSVPFANAAPLVWWFDTLGSDSPVEVVYALPSALPDLLESGEVEAILVSSVDPLVMPGRCLVKGIGIVSHGAVASVKILSRIPIREIESLALDSSSMTSNLLARIILHEVYGVSPGLTVAEPNLTDMLETADACVLIGDKGLEANAGGTICLDLGAEWQRLTGLPFLWAGWVGRESICVELCSLLHRALEESGFGRESESEKQQSVCEWAAKRAGWSYDSTYRYLRDNVAFIADDKVEEGYRVFGKFLQDLEMVPKIPPVERATACKERT